MHVPDPQRSRVVLIGAGAYDDEKLPNLPAVGRTVGDLAAALTDPDYGLVPESHCTVLMDEGDLRLIGRELRASARQAGDLLLVSYTGHGLVGGRRHDLYLALPESEWGDPEFSSLEYDKLRNAVLDSPAATKIIILDCCFSGRVTTDAMADPVTAMMGQIDVEGTYVLASAQRDQVALILPGEEHTAFTGRLLRLLREGVADGPELFTIEDLYLHLRVTMKAEGLSEPQKRCTRTAELLAFARNRAYAATAVPLLLERQAAAIALGEGGDWAGAVELLRVILAEQTRVLGPGHPDTLRTRQFLAHGLGGAGDPLEGAAMLRELLAEQLRRRGAEAEPDTLRTRQFLAVNLGEAGHRDEAVALLRVLLPDRRRILGPEDPDTLRTGHMLARNLTLTGDLDEASALLREVIATRERTLAPDHPHTRRARSDLDALLSRRSGGTDV
ncbi:tetratricopeptide repeat protein [Actinomadura sp. DC4]|uniref:caspase, EACC1-associated type n=1 Tax=Actinomadura sp. DC4 TaxID=3055069 RepID=UPI0025B2296B|nr:tetratricopeptide repeat protein [Actinomadura sp. DC4]MDN3351205.1 tetratricopeptide repeat protein [Actinomadura sp. DC4]